MKYFSLLFLTFIVLSCSKSDDPKALKRISEGNAFLDQKNYSSALIAFKDAQKYDLSVESLAKNYRNISICFSNLEQLDSAKANAKKSFEVAEEYSYLYHNNKGEHILLHNQVEAALKEFRLAEKRDETQMEVWNNMSLIYSGAYDSTYLNLNLAIVYAQKAYDIKQNATNKEQLASVLFQMENFQSAGNLYASLSKEFPQVKMHQFNEGQCLYFAGKEEEGKKMMEEAAERDEKCRLLLEELIQ
ncbi:MAG: hypothetical protein ACK5B9_08910 [Flavobacteriia bacterium]